MTVKPEVRLRPCPFCGHKVDEEIVFGGIFMYKCRNENCGAIISFNNALTKKFPHLSTMKWNERKE